MLDNIKRNSLTREVKVCDRKIAECNSLNCNWFKHCVNTCWTELSFLEREILLPDEEEILLPDEEGIRPAKKPAPIRQATQAEQEELVETDKLIVLKSRVEAAAKKCPQAKNVLKELFPEVFKATGYRCGSIFAAQAGIHCSPTQKTLLKYKSGGWALKNPSGIAYESSALIQLVHTRTSKQYRLIHMNTGYAWDDSVYKRIHSGSKLITIPAEDLIHFTLVYQPGD